jgi:hypothetical protein
VRGDPLPDGSRPHWSPLSHTLIAGPTEAAVVDPPITVAQGDALGDWLAAAGVRLKAIYLTRSHADHWLSTVRLLARFPSARVHAGPLTAARIFAAGSPGPLWAALFPDQLPAAPLDFEISSDPFTIDGAPMVPVEAGHSDTDDTTGSCPRPRPGTSSSRASPRASRTASTRPRRGSRRRACCPHRIRRLAYAPRPPRFMAVTMPTGVAGRTPSGARSAHVDVC